MNLKASTGGATRRLDAIARQARDTRPAMRGTAEWTAKENARRWGRGPALAASTREAKARRGQPATPLVASGATKRAVTTTAGTRVTDDHVTITAPAHAKYGFGTKHEPKRLALVSSKAVAAEGARRTLDHLVDR